MKKYNYHHRLIGAVITIINALNSTAMEPRANPFFWTIHSLLVLKLTGLEGDGARQRE